MKTQFEEIINRIKTLVWGAFWVAAAFFVDNLSGALVGVKLPDYTIDVFGSPMTINTAILLGLAVTQISKYVHNKKQGKFE